MRMKKNKMLKEIYRRRSVGVSLFMSDFNIDLLKTATNDNVNTFYYMTLTNYNTSVAGAQWLRASNIF